jgi:tRNA pseudouridine38-40 synthase
MKLTYKITISYDGTDYFGWQRQPDKKTIQGTLENVLYNFLSKKINVLGAGRTDAGVHAVGQVAHFRADMKLENSELQQAINGQLPHDIRVTTLEKTGPDFHARKSALSKIYQYRIFNTRDISPFLIRYALYIPAPLNITKMKKAAAHFIREDDFSAFSSNRLLHPVRNVFRSEIRKKGEEIIYTVEATGFLKYMVRTLVGTLLEIGKGKLEPKDIDKLFKQKKRSLSAPTAPSKGLCLVKVKY